MNYWNKREEMAAKAITHAADMLKRYQDEINSSVECTSIYDSYNINYNINTKVSTINNSNPNNSTNVFLVDIDTIAAANYVNTKYGGKVAILNFASYKNAGGKYKEGSSAQEEFLCHHSTLYNVLSCFEKIYYRENRINTNHSLYLNKALYSPSIIFEYCNMFFKADVITCAAPNKSAAKKYSNISDKENFEELEKRIKFLFDIAMVQKVDTLVLGAWGCGVFGQNPTEVARLFKKYIDETAGYFKNIVFAIPDKTSNNYIKFKEVLNPCKDLFWSE